MAHRTNVTQVTENIEAGLQEKVTDPVCGKQMTRQEARHVLFRFDDKYYFCSRECRDRFGRQAA